ncbi:MAG: UDP-N-acetylmuramate--L-alanine ligase [Alphaproteobacteria bacterium]
MMKYFFCGIGGSGMSALASALRLQGFEVAGSDRSFDNKQNLELKQKLEKIGIIIKPQDGSGINNSFDALVISSAVEPSIPDVKKALDIKLKIIKRAELLADVFNKNAGIAIGGTSGKTTVTGICGHILQKTGLDPFVINGGIINGSQEGIGNAVLGTGKMVIEADESDGSIALYNPQIAVITNISLDHKSLDELNVLFADFVKRASIGAVLNMDCEKTFALKQYAKKFLSYSVKNPEADILASNIILNSFGSSFEVFGEKVILNIPGIHNISNTLAAIAASILLGADAKQAAKAASSFCGIKRRLEVIGKFKNITVIDDFAHNPDKINASMAALKKMGTNVKIFFQMHGFAPTKLFGRDIAKVFAKYFEEGDIIVVPEIYYAGGTVDKSISSKLITDEINRQGKEAYFFESRLEAKNFIIETVVDGDVVVVMGARDNTLSDLAKEIFQALTKRSDLCGKS